MISKASFIRLYLNTLQLAAGRFMAYYYLKLGISSNLHTESYNYQIFSLKNSGFVFTPWQHG